MATSSAILKENYTNKHKNLHIFYTSVQFFHDINVSVSLCSGRDLNSCR